MPYQIQTLLQQNLKQYEIADFVKVSKSTISREIRRNCSLSNDYIGIEAHKSCSGRCKREPYKMKGNLKEQVLAHLKARFSPEQISGVLALETGQKLVSHECIYRYIYSDKHNDNLISFLRVRHKKKYNKRGSAGKRGLIPNRVGIENRPAIVETNTEIGHWEGDTVIGANHQGVLLTLVERVTKYTIVAKLPSKNAESLSNILISRAKKCRIPIKSITFDNAGPPVRKRVCKTSKNQCCTEDECILCKAVSELGKGIK